MWYSAVENVGARPLSLIGNCNKCIDPVNELIKFIGSVEVDKKQG